MRILHRARERKELPEQLAKKRKEGAKEVFLIRQRYYFDEGETSHPSKPYAMKDLRPVEGPPIMKHISFSQTVGLSDRIFEVPEEIECLDPAGRPLRAMIRGIEKNYYYVVYDDKSNIDTPYEWIHRNSARLRKLSQYDQEVQEEKLGDLFDRLQIGMYVMALYPDGEMVPGRVLHKHVERKDAGPFAKKNEHVTIKYDGDRLSRQKTFSREQVNDSKGKFVRVENPNKVTQKNKSMHFISSLKAINLEVVEMNKEGGHSMFRALSYQLFGTQTNWKAIRRMCVHHLLQHKEYFQHFIDCEFEQYVAAKRKAMKSNDFYAPGDHLDIQAICEIYDVGVKIYSDKASRPFEYISFYSDPHNRFQSKLKLGNILLFYRGNDEYDCLVDQAHRIPLKREIGFQKVKKDLGQLTSRDIKGEILKARQEEFETLMLQKSGSSKKKNVRAAIFKGEWMWNKNIPVEKTVQALLKTFNLKTGSSQDGFDKADLRFEAKPEVECHLYLKIQAPPEAEDYDPKTAKQVPRLFTIIGVRKKAIQLREFCEEYFEGLRLEQTASCCIGSVK